MTKYHLTSSMPRIPKRSPSTWLTVFSIVKLIMTPGEGLRSTSALVFNSAMQSQWQLSLRGFSQIWLFNNKNESKHT